MSPYKQTKSNMYRSIVNTPNNDRNIMIELTCQSSCVSGYMNKLQQTSRAKTVGKVSPKLINKKKCGQFPGALFPVDVFERMTMIIKDSHKDTSPSNR